MRKLICVLATAGLVALASCASMRDEVISGFCGANPRDEPRWTRIGPPANAETYRTLARADAQLSRPGGGEYWFARTNGEVKYCVTPLTRASTVPERNGSGCDDRIGAWWVFRQTAAGPATHGAEERICVN